MVRQEGKDTIKKIEDHYRKKGGSWKCKREYVSLNSSDPEKSQQQDRTDLICWNKKLKKVRFFEVEDSCRSVVKNLRCGVKNSKQMKRQGYNDSKFCMLIAGENFLEVCNENKHS